MSKETLTEEQKKRIREQIAKITECEDKDIEEVIEDQFKGDETAYLLAMAHFHNILLNEG